MDAPVRSARDGMNFARTGPYVRFPSVGGPSPLTLKGWPMGKEADGTPIAFHANSIGKPLATKPAWTTAPPYNFTADCYKQSLPDFAHSATGPSDAATP